MKDKLSKKEIDKLIAKKNALLKNRKIIKK